MSREAYRTRSERKIYEFSIKEHKHFEEGKLADINVFDKNIFEDDEELPNMKCSMTVFNGEIVYKAD